MRTRLLLLYLLAWGIAPRLRGAKALASVAPPPKADDLEKAEAEFYRSFNLNWQSV